MLNQYAVDNPTLPVNQCFSHLIQILVLCQAVLWECRAATMRHQVFWTHMIKRKRFCKSNGVFFSTLSARVEPMDLQCIRTHITTCDGEDTQRNMGRTNNDCRFQILILTNTMPATFAFWKIRFKTELCISSQFPTEATLWIKGVEMVDSVDDLKSSCSL